jgi:hypothetical protein
MAQWSVAQTDYIALLNQQLPEFGNVAFPATRLGSADPNTLDDYEEGVLVLVVSFGGLSTGITYGTQSGRYTKIGERVIATGLVRLTAKGSSTGQARIGGLPFTVNNNANSYAPVALQLGVVTHSGHPQGYADINTTTVVLTEQAVGGGAYTSIVETDFSNNSEVLIGLEYVTAS